MLEDLKKKVFEANLLLPQYKLVTFTWGNVSELDRDSGLLAIKPSGVEYDLLKAEDMVILDLDGNVIEGTLRPSSDYLTHIELYKAFGSVNGIVHTHSSYATAWAQSGLPISCYGTTHADYFYKDIPITRALTPKEVEEGYEKNTGKVIIECFKDRDVLSCPGVLCVNHGPFTFGEDAKWAVHNAVVLEEVAKMAMNTLLINPSAFTAPIHVQNKHYFRKHGKNAYYGQVK